MASVNKVILIGNLGSDPEVRYTQQGKAMASFNSPPANTGKTRKEKKQERTEWHRIIAFGKLGEICGQYLAKGKPVYVEGRIASRNWEDSEGNRKTITEIIAGTMKMLGSQENDGIKEIEPEGTEIPDDEIPF